MVLESMDARRKRWRNLLIGVLAFVLVLGGFVWFVLFRRPASLVGERVLPGGRVEPQIATANGRALLVAPDGSLWGWGVDNTAPPSKNSKVPVRIGEESDWRRVALGALHTLAIKTNGTLWGWGFNVQGQLGFPNNVDVVRLPKRLDAGTNWAQISAGGLFTLALKTDGSLWTCGRNSSGQIGDGTRSNRFGLWMVTPERDWKMIATGLENSFGIKRNGTLWGWGSDPSLAGQDDLTPAQLGSDTNWAYVAASHFEVFALKSDGTLWIGGHNAKSTARAYVPVRKRGLTQMGTDADWKEIYAGHGYYFARKADGTWWIGGDNSWGELGIGGAHGIIRRQTLEKPERLPFAIEPWALALAPGMPSTHLLAKDGVLWSWGTRLGVEAPSAKLRPWKLRFNRFLYQLSGQRINGFSLQEEAIDATPRKLWELPEEVTEEEARRK
jgi:alpha-tubulin suppressor-like RCC1 family protein